LDSQQSLSAIFQAQISRNVAGEMKTADFYAQKPAPGLISAGDIGFVGADDKRVDEIGGTLVCVADGIQASGSKQCRP